RELGREDRHVGGPARGRDARDRRDDPAESGHREPVTRVDAVRVQEIALEVEQEEGGGAPADRHDGIVCPMPRYDTAVLNGTVIMPYVGPLRCDIGVRDGRVAALADRIAPGEVDWLVGEPGVGSFKYYMFYKGLTLASDSTRGSAYTMSDAYDLRHLYLLMRRVASASAGNGPPGRVSLSLHCEQAELIRVFIEEVRRSGPRGLEGYHRARPPLTERLSIAEAMVLADATRCPVNLLHLSSD